MKTEQWKWIPRYEKRYEVSTHGRVRSYVVCGHNLVNDNPQKYLILDHSHPCGYLCVRLCKDLISKKYLVHRLVLMAFVGPCPFDFQTGHLDGEPSNNFLDNLQWVSAKENKFHQKRHGTWIKGEKCGSVKLSENQVKIIIQRLNRGDTQKSIAKDYGVDRSNVGYIANNKTWKHIPRDTEVPY